MVGLTDPGGEQLVEATSGEEETTFWEEEEILDWRYDSRDIFSEKNLHTRYSAVTAVIKKCTNVVKHFR